MKYARWILVLMILAVSVCASAQMPASDRVVAQVPFTFVVANRVVPYGQFTVQRTGPMANVFAVSNPEANISFVVTATAKRGIETAGEYSLIFHRYGNRYFLTALKIAGSDTVYSIAQSRYEEELLAQNMPAAEEVLLASAR